MTSESRLRNPGIYLPAGLGNLLAGAMRCAVAGLFGTDPECARDERGLRVTP